jgi:hypothetical protein
MKLLVPALNAHCMNAWFRQHGAFRAGISKSWERDYLVWMQATCTHATCMWLSAVGEAGRGKDDGVGPEAQVIFNAWCVVFSHTYQLQSLEPCLKLCAAAVDFECGILYVEICMDCAACHVSLQLCACRFTLICIFIRILEMLR